MGRRRETQTEPKQEGTYRQGSKTYSETEGSQLQIFFTGGYCNEHWKATVCTLHSSKVLPSQQFGSWCCLQWFIYLQGWFGKEACIQYFGLEVRYFERFLGDQGESLIPIFILIDAVN